MGIDERNRQTDYVVIATFDGANKLRSEPLNRVRSGLISRLPASSVLLNVVLRKLQEGNPGTGEIENPACAGENTDAGIDLVVAAREAAEDPGGIVIAGGLSEDLVVHTDYRVGAEDDVLWRGHDRPGLLLCNSPNELRGALAGVPMFGNRAGPDDVIDAGGQKQLMTAGRG
jgi:hypothetical protein